jgi:hypothetical protein
MADAMYSVRSNSARLYMFYSPVVGYGSMFTVVFSVVVVAFTSAEIEKLPFDDDATTVRL